jgi:hypothetical protein
MLVLAQIFGGYLLAGIPRKAFLTSIGLIDAGLCRQGVYLLKCGQDLGNTRVRNDCRKTPKGINDGGPP